MSGYIQNDKDTPAVLFHYTRHDIDIAKLLPFTHFGTCQAAHERWCGTGSSNPGARFFPVVLKMSNPLEVKDSGDLDIFFGAKELIKAGVDKETLEWVYRPLITSPVSRQAFHAAASSAHSYHDFQPPSCGAVNESLKQRFLRHIGFGGEDAIKPMRDNEVSEELDTESFYLTPVNSGEERRCLKDQRKIQALEALGYDGLVYTNQEEHAGSKSYCIFRPEQVVPAFEYDWGVKGMPKVEVNFDSYKIYWSEIYDPDANNTRPLPCKNPRLFSRGF